MPYVTSTIAIGIVFRYFFNGSYGIINYLLNFLGFESINWLDNVNMSMTNVDHLWGLDQFAFNIIILIGWFK